MIASLAMYDRPETAGALDRLWEGVRGRLGYGPEKLNRSGDLRAVWRSPDLLLAQSCGLPFRARLAGEVTLVGALDYGVGGCAPGYYRSVIVARRGGMAPGGRLAVNDGLSQSGWAAALDFAAERGLSFTEVIETGGHAASAEAVATGRADLAAIDAVTWRLIARHDRVGAALSVIARTAARPGLPLITAKDGDAAALFAAIEGAVAALAAADRATLGIIGIAALPEAAYLRLPVPRPPGTVPVA